MFICSYHIYKLSFLNFLLGKQPNGPGQFMFGTVNWDSVTSWLDISLISPPPPDTALVDTKNNKKLPSQENNPNTVNYDNNKSIWEQSYINLYFLNKDLKVGFILDNLVFIFKLIK